MRYYGQWKPPVDRVLHERYFPTTRGGVFLEAGAFDGRTESCCLAFEESLGWRGINLEPMPYLYRLLERNRPGSLNLQLALSDREGTATLTHIVHPEHGWHFGNGSLEHDASHRATLLREGCVEVRVEVPTATYAQLVGRLGLNRLDLFVLDVEGHELAALKGMAGADVMPRVMCVEFPNVGLPALEEVLGDFGYGLDHVAENNAFFLLGVEEA